VGSDVVAGLSGAAGDVAVSDQASIRDDPADADLLPVAVLPAAPADPGRPSPITVRTRPQPTAADATVAPAWPCRPRAAETRRLYAADWAAFVAWCRNTRHVPLPASPATVATYLATLTTLKHGALARRAAAIADQHHRNGHVACSGRS